jgi:hypothetical protein
MPAATAMPAAAVRWRKKCPVSITFSPQKIYN